MDVFTDEHHFCAFQSVDEIARSKITNKKKLALGYKQATLQMNDLNVTTTTQLGFTFCII